MAEKIGYRTVNWIASLSYCLVFFLTSYIRNAYFLLYFFGIFGGLTCGMCYLTCIYISWTYFPEKRGFATGWILFAAGFSASLLSPISTYILDPTDKLKPDDPEQYNRVPHMFRMMSLMFVVNSVLACTIQPDNYESEDLKKSIM